MNALRVEQNILIVDDSLTVRMDLKDFVESVGFKTTLCSNANEAKAALLKERVDLILLDLQLPDMSGLEFLKEVRSQESTNHIPVIILSSEANIQERNSAAEMGSDDFIGKPYESSYLLAKINELLLKHDDQGAIPSKRTRVLVIDDSATYRAEISSRLSAAGYSVLLAGTGEEGLSIAVTARPDAVIVDGKLPGIEGATVIQRIRSDIALRNTPCLLLTASTDPKDESQALDAGADTYVRKDMDLDIVLAHLSSILRTVPTLSSASKEKSLLSPKRILAVDDSPTYLHELENSLKQEGYNMILARSGEEALKLLQTQLVDCILLDCVMPGISGEETCRIVKKTSNLRDIPVILLTGKDNYQAMLQGFGAGADDYISKSSEIRVLKARLRAQLRRKQFEDDSRRAHDELLRKEAEISEARIQKEFSEAREKLLNDLENVNRELEAFSYSVSHDLKSPLRVIQTYSEILLNSHKSSLDEEGQGYLERIAHSSKSMEILIDALLSLPRLVFANLKKENVDLSAIAKSLLEDLQTIDPHRKVDVQIAPQLCAQGDPGLLRSVLQNLLNNAWKFTSKKKDARIEFGQLNQSGVVIYFVRDNGAGFDMNRAKKLFQAFQRLHSVQEFEGTGIGLATVQRIIQRHGGKIWAEGEVGKGATFYFSLSEGVT